MEELIRAAKKGNPDAFTSLMQSQMKSMYKTARAMLKNDEDAADAISETILACWEKIEQLRCNEYFRTWMTRILINKCKNIMKAKETLSSTKEMTEIPFSEDGYCNVEWKEALHSLGEKYCIVMVLYYVEGFNTADISQILKMPESTVRSRLVKGRTKMAEKYSFERRTSI